MTEVFLPSIVVGLGNTGKTIIEVLYKNLSENYLSKTGISLVSIASNQFASIDGRVITENNGILSLDFPSDKTSRERFLRDFRSSNIPNILCDTVVFDLNKNASRSQIVVVASLGEIESALIGDVLHHLHSGFSADNFTSYICLSLNTSLTGNRIRNEEIYAGLRELTRLGKYGYHFMGFPDEKISSKSDYDFMFIFDSKTNQFDAGKVDDSSISIELFIENILKETNFQIGENLFQAIRNTMDQVIDDGMILGNCINSSIRTVQSPTKVIKRNIAIELLNYKLMSLPSKNIDWDQVDREVIEWFEDKESPKAKDLYSLIFKAREGNPITILEADLSAFIKSFQICIHQGVEKSLKLRTSIEGLQIVEDAIHSIIDHIDNQLTRSNFEPSKNSILLQELFKELLKEARDTEREIIEWKTRGFTVIDDILKHELEDAQKKLVLGNSIQVFSAPTNDIHSAIDNFIRNSKNGSNDTGKYLLESLDQYISIEAKENAGFQMQLITGSDQREEKHYEPDQMRDFIDDCLDYLESNLDINPFTVEQRIANLTEHLNKAMAPSCEMIVSNKINSRFEHSSYLISHHNKVADKLLASVFTDTSTSAKLQIFDETSETEVSAIRIFYNIPLNDIKKINQMASDYYLDPTLYIFQQERNAILIEKKIRNLDRNISKLLIPGKVVDLLFDMDLVDKFLVAAILGILIKEADSNDRQYWKFNIQKTGRYMDPVICEADGESLKELFSVLQEFSMVLPNEDQYRIERANHFFYHENRRTFLHDLQKEIDRRINESDLKEVCRRYWERMRTVKNGGANVERGMKILIIYEMMELLHSNYELKKIIGDGGLDELG